LYANRRPSNAYIFANRGLKKILKNLGIRTFCNGLYVFKQKNTSKVTINRYNMNYIATCKRGITLLCLLVVYSQGIYNMAFADELSQKSQPAAIKVDEIDLYHATKKRPVKLDLWYKENTCMDKECKQKSTAKLNIAILSHGAMGVAKDYSWLAYPLAAKG
jgi:hypothetical protein